MTYSPVGIGTDLSARTAHEAADAVNVRLIADKTEWDALIALAGTPHLPQSFAYGEGKAADGWHVERALLAAGGRPLAIATVLSFRRLGVRILNRINRGPIFVGSEPTDDEVTAVYAKIRSRWGQLPGAPLLIAPALPQGERSESLLRRAGYRLRNRRSWCSGRIDLTADSEALWSGVTSGFRNRVRNAWKAGAQLRMAEDAGTYHWMLDRHVENMSAKHFAAVRPSMLEAMRAASPRDVVVFQALRDNRPVAGMSVVRFGSHAEYHIGWFGPEGRKLNAGNFLMWNILLEMKRRSVGVFDVGGLKPGDGYTRFKQTMNPAEYSLAGEWMSF